MDQKPEEKQPETEQPKQPEVLPMLELFRKYCKQVEASDRNGKIIAAAILTGFDTILRYADYMIKAQATPVEPEPKKKGWGK